MMRKLLGSGGICFDYLAKAYESRRGLRQRSILLVAFFFAMILRALAIFVVLGFYYRIRKSYPLSGRRVAAFRNSGFAVVTVLIRLALIAPPPGAKKA